MQRFRDSITLIFLFVIIIIRCDLICDVISCVWNCNVGKVIVYDKIMIENQKEKEIFTQNSITACTVVQAVV